MPFDIQTESFQPGEDLVKSSVIIDSLLHWILPFGFVQDQGLTPGNVAMCRRAMLLARLVSDMLSPAALLPYLLVVLFFPDVEGCLFSEPQSC